MHSVSRGMRTVFTNRAAIAALTIPALAVMLFAIVAPIALSVYYSFTSWSGFGKLTFVGFHNYRELILSDSTFWRSLANAGLLALVTVLVQNPIAFLLAVALSKIGRSRLFRTIYFVPAILPVVVITKLWVGIFNPNYGLLNKVLQGLGLRGFQLAWLSDPATALWSLIFVMIWYGFGWALLFYYSGLMTMSREVEEAAIIDGVSRLQLYTRVVIPYIFPVVQAVLIIAVVSSLKQMEVIYLSTNGAPGDTTQFVANYLYLKAFSYGEYGYGSAISVVFVAVALLVTAATRRMTSRDPGVD